MFKHMPLKYNVLLILLLSRHTYYRSRALFFYSFNKEFLIDVEANVKCTLHERQTVQFRPPIS